MSKFTKEQLTTILALYYFDESKLDTKFLKTFTDKFNSKNHSDVSTQNISYAITVFRNLNPSYSVDSNEADQDYQELWDYYISNDRVKELRQIYNNFKSGVIHEVSVVPDDKLSDNLSEKFEKFEYNFEEDCVKPLYVMEEEFTARYNLRDMNVAYNALKLANFTCEFNASHESFMRKNVNERYTEGHHLVPLKYQNVFDVNLDVEANVVSLCSECHNKIHYGRDYEEIVSSLYEKRKDRLEKCGIKISLQELLGMYRG